jgi:hypothetical protein
MNRLTLGTECKKGHDLTIPNAIYTSSDPDKIVRRCRMCWQEYQRNLQRKKRGTPLDAPVRAYKPQVRKPQAVKELINLISNDHELAEKLLQYVPQARRSISSRRILTKPIHDNC